MNYTRPTKGLARIRRYHSLRRMDWSSGCAVVIPCLNEAASIGPLIVRVRRHLPVVIVVDDGSTDGTSGLAAAEGAEVLALAGTRGKGTALRTGLGRARERGFAWALLADGDGQHAPEDVPVLLAAAEHAEVALVVGNRMGNTGGMPRIRRWVNRLMSWMLSRLTGRNLPDTQCGFRLVRLDAWSELSLTVSHFEVESEMLVAFLAAGHGVAFTPVRTLYLGGGSKIKPVRDTVRWLRWLWRSRHQFARIRRQAMADALRASSMMRVP